MGGLVDDGLVDKAGRGWFGRCRELGRCGCGLGLGGGPFWGGGVDIKAGDFALAGGEVIGLPSHSLLGSRRVDLASGGIYAC